MLFALGKQAQWGSCLPSNPPLDLFTSHLCSLLQTANPLPGRVNDQTLHLGEGSGIGRPANILLCTGLLL